MARPRKATYSAVVRATSLFGLVRGDAMSVLSRIQ